MYQQRVCILEGTALSEFMVHMLLFSNTQNTWMGACTVEILQLVCFVFSNQYKKHSRKWKCISCILLPLIQKIDTTTSTDTTITMLLSSVHMAYNMYTYVVYMLEFNLGVSCSHIHVASILVCRYTLACASYSSLESSLVTVLG